MNDAPLRLFDIIPMADRTYDLSLFLILGLALFFSLSLAVWARYYTPISKLQRALNNGVLSPREVCHRLAVMTSDKALLMELDQARFMRDEPTPSEVQALINKVQHAH
jgi:hypothetical protein